MKRIGKIVLSVVIVIILLSVLSKLYTNYKYSKVNRLDIQVQILNACGVDGLATIIGKIMRDKGYDVVDIGNCSHTPKTVVWDRYDENGKYAKIVARDIGCKYVSAHIDSSLFIKVTIVVGDDYWDLFGEEIKDLGYDRSLKRRF